jgi:hypothetical protein
MVQPVYTLKERIKILIGNIAWKVYLWAYDMSEAEMSAMLVENAMAEYKSEKANSLYA